MKLKLFDFQEQVLGTLRNRVFVARAYAANPNATPQAIVFSAPTGSGKTIIMGALFEDILFGEVDFPAQPDAVILWVSDMPELNEQTRLKIEGKSDRIRTGRLVTIDAAFDAERLEGGYIYFINTQKLGNDKLLTRQGDGRTWPIWTTLTNTARESPDRFYVVIDEAHRGMTSPKQAKEARTLMQRFLLGHKESGLIPMPLVIGVSATPKRFMDLLEKAKDTTIHKAEVRADEVRESGLLKERILIHHPDSPTTAEMALLAEAARRWANMRSAWQAYCQAEGERMVWPILVVQVANATATAADVTQTNLRDALDTIEDAIGRPLREGEVAHALHECGDLDVGGRRVRRVEASRIDEDKNIGVVLFKTSLSTGWDCPRAEVMMSFRAAQDHTYIAQLLGRMVRTPLARRIGRDAALNDVHLFVPYFDAAGVQAVITDLYNVEEVPPAETGSARELVILSRRSGLEAVFAALSQLITYRVNAARAQSHLRRYVGLARGLTLDQIDAGVWDEAKAAILAWMDDELATLKASTAFGQAEKAITQVEIATLEVEQGTHLASPGRDYAIEATAVDIERRFEAAGRVLGNGLHALYWQAHAERDALEVKVEIIVLAGDAVAMKRLESRAEQAFDQGYDQFKAKIGALAEGRRQKYERLRLATAKPVVIPWALPDTIDFRRSSGAPSFDKHLYLEDDGLFRADLGTWEAEVLKAELANPQVVAWLRNQDRKPWSLEIPYHQGGEVRPMFPDLVVVRQVPGEDGYLFDILEPHDPSRDDNVGKAVGLARFAEQHGHLFGRIQLIRRQPSPAGGEAYYRLNINKLAVQKKLLEITTGPQLDALFVSDAVIGL